jgi:hypothetical protein
MSALFCMVDNYQYPHLCWSVDRGSGLLVHCLACPSMAIRRRLLSSPAFGCIILSGVEDVEHVFEWLDKALGFGFCDQLLYLRGVLVGRAGLAAAAMLTRF